MFAGRTNWDLRPNRLSVALAERRAAGLPVIDLTASNPTECGFVYDSAAILAALHNPLSLKYEPEPRGLLSAREAVCAYYASRGDAVSPDDVVLTTSTSEAYSFAFRLLCNAGDEVLVPQPSYPLFDFLAELHDVRLLRYPLIYDHGWQIDVHALRERLTERTRAVIVVHPNNPTGHFCKAREIAELNEICAARGMAIIADEVFLDYALGAETAGSFAANGVSVGGPPANADAAVGRALTFTMSGLSKICGLPQMKAAWIVTTGQEAAKREALARLEVIADTFLSMNAPVQHAMAGFLRQRVEFQAQILHRVRVNLGELDRVLAAQNASAVQGGCSRLELEGGWYAVVQMPAGRDSGELTLALLKEHGVYLHPGHFYELPGERYVVISLIAETCEFSTGVQGLLKFVDQARA